MSVGYVIAQLKVTNSENYKEYVNKVTEIVKKFDGEYPQKYENDFFNYISMKKNEFLELSDKFRPNHLWDKQSNRWVLKKLL